MPLPMRVNAEMNQKARAAAASGNKAEANDARTAASVTAAAVWHENRVT